MSMLLGLTSRLGGLALLEMKTTKGHGRVLGRARRTTMIARVIVGGTGGGTIMSGARAGMHWTAVVD